MIYRVIILGIILVTVLGCKDVTSEENRTEGGVEIITNPEYGPWQMMENPPLSMTLQDSILFSETGEYLITDISYLTSDDNGYLYFLDRRQSKLISVDPDNGVRWIIGQKGQGPGDFDRPTDLLVSDKYLYVVNIAGSRIDLFDFEGNFVQAINLNKELLLSKLKGFINNDQLLITTPLWGKIGSNVYIGEFERDSIVILNHFVLNRSKGREFGPGNNASPDIYVEGEHFAMGSKTDYSISRYDFDGNLILKVTRDFDKIVPPGYYEDGDYGMFTTFGGLEFIQTLPNGYFLTLAQWPINIGDPNKYVQNSMEGNSERLIFKHSLDVFNPDNRLMYSYEGDGLNPAQGNLAHVDENGTLYFTQKDSTVAIYIYRILFEE